MQRTIGLRRAVTIKDLAAEAGVSLQTVSRVINDGPNVRGRSRRASTPPSPSWATDLPTGRLVPFSLIERASTGPAPA